MPAAAPRRSLWARIADGDRAAMARIHATHSPALDRVMPALSRAANHSVLWFGVAAGLLSVAAPWLIRNTVLYGDPFNIKIFPLTAPPSTPTTARTSSGRNSAR